MTELSKEDHKQWYEAQRPIYELLTSTVKNILESLIKSAEIDYLSITGRAKDVDSFIEKIGRKSYQEPTQEITDLAGIRVITFIESDALKVNELIKRSFTVDDSKSLDKSGDLGIDKIGYRSFHFICDLGVARCALPEFEIFKGLVFEIQVRTVLQHAWAEIEHDRNYKFAGVLPNHVRRRLHLLAGVLELADGEFDRLAGEIDKYAEEVSQKTRTGNLNIELNTISLYEYLLNIKSRFTFDIEVINSSSAWAKTLGELYLFGIEKISELEALFSEEFLNRVNQFKHVKYLSLPYIVSDALMYADIDRYFQQVSVRNYIALDKETTDLLIGKYGSEKVYGLLEANEISIIDWDTAEFTFGKLKGKKLGRSSNILEP